MIHPDVLEAMEQIDAAFFSSDTFFAKQDRQVIEEKLARWNHEVEQLRNDDKE